MHSFEFNIDWSEHLPWIYITGEIDLQYGTEDLSFLLNIEYGTFSIDSSSMLDKNIVDHVNKFLEKKSKYITDILDKVGLSQELEIIFNETI